MFMVIVAGDVGADCEIDARSGFDGPTLLISSSNRFNSFISAANALDLSLNFAFTIASFVSFVFRESVIGSDELELLLALQNS